MTVAVGRLYGRRPPKRHAAMALADILTGVVPTHPVSQDNLARLSAWKMLGNDVAGDCVAVTWANFRRLVTTILTGSGVYPTQDLVWAVYKTQNPNFNPKGSASTNGPGSNADRGMDIQTLLEYLVKTGVPDVAGGPNVKAVAFAKVDYTNLEEVKAALSIFGGIWTGINVQAAQQDQFSEGVPWDYVSGSPDEGGHSICSGGYKGTALSDVTFITWAAETSFTDKFWTRLVEEAWVVIWPEHLGTASFQTGVSGQKLADAYSAVTNGKVLVIPSVTPPPAPSPTPSPTNDGATFLDAHPDLAAHVAGTAAKAGLTRVAWLVKHLDGYLHESD